MTYIASLHIDGFHLDAIDHEQEMTPGPSRWERWLDRVAYLTGIDDLDGSYELDGYSLDILHGQYKDRWSPKRAARALMEVAR